MSLYTASLRKKVKQKYFNFILADLRDYLIQVMLVLRQGLIADLDKNGAIMLASVATVETW